MLNALMQIESLAKMSKMFTFFMNNLIRWHDLSLNYYFFIEMAEILILKLCALRKFRTFCSIFAIPHRISTEFEIRLVPIKKLVYIVPFNTFYVIFNPEITP